MPGPRAAELASSLLSVQTNLSARSASSVGSNFSISATFRSLSARDVRFFDRIIDRVPPGSSDFASLKGAYNALTRQGASDSEDDSSGAQKPDEDRAAREARLWDLLLSLLKVRGRDWAERWNSVRLAIGLEPRSSESEVGEAEDRLARGVISTTSSRQGDGHALRYHQAAQRLQQRRLQDTIVSQASRPPPYEHIAGSTATPTSWRPHDDKAAGAFDAIVDRARTEHQAALAARAAAIEAEQDARWAPRIEEADRIFAATLKDACFSWWRTALSRTRQRERSVAQARREVEMAKALESWRVATARNVARRRGAAEHDAGRVLKGAFSQWVQLRRQRRTQRKEGRKQELREAWNAVRKRRQARLVKATFDDWRRARKLASAQRRHETYLLRGALCAWRLLAARSAALDEKETQVKRAGQNKALASAFGRWRSLQTLQARLRQWQARKRSVILWDAFETWQRGSALSMVARAQSQDRLLRSSFSRWRNAQSEAEVRRRRQAAAQSWDEKRAQRSAFRIWRTRSMAVEDLERRADAFIQRRDQGLCQTALKSWQTKEREGLLNRVKRTRVLVTALSTWRKRREQHASSLVALNAQADRRRRHELGTHALKRWTEALRQRRSSERLATTWERSRTVQKALHSWISRKASIDDSARSAQRTADQIRLYGAWQKWADRRRQCKLESWGQAKGRQVRLGSLRHWKQSAGKRRHERVAVATMQSRIEERLARGALERWTAETIRRKSEEIEATERRAMRLKHAALERWGAAWLRVKALVRRCDEQLELRAKDDQARALQLWLGTTRRRQDLRAKEEGLALEQRRRTLQSFLGRWIEAAKEVELQSKELAVRTRRQDIVARSVLHIWQAATESLPAIRFRNEHIKHAALQQWRLCLPLVRDERRAERLEQHHLAGKALTHWLSTMRSRRSFRAAVRFGGPSVARLRTVTHQSSSPRGPFARSSSSPSPAVKSGASQRLPPRVDEVRERPGKMRIQPVSGLDRPPTSPRRRAQLADAAGGSENVALERWAADVANVATASSRIPDEEAPWASPSVRACRDRPRRLDRRPSSAPSLTSDAEVSEGGGRPPSPSKSYGVRSEATARPASVAAAEARNLARRGMTDERRAGRRSYTLLQVTSTRRLSFSSE